MITIFAGLAAGLIHVLSGPDHLAAIAPLAVKKPRGSWLAGLRWGLGHSAGVLVIGALSLLLRGMIPVDLISNSSDRIVGVLLIGIGAWTLRKALQIHSHEHVHDGELHEHIHMHPVRKKHEHAHGHAAFGIGTLHGLAGSSHFLGILPALALPSNWLAGTYLVAFGAGTVVAMILFSHFIGAVASRFAVNMWKTYRGMMYACSALAFGVGTAWLAGYSF
jgi:sulfite exporter TauE/SafE